MRFKPQAIFAMCTMCVITEPWHPISCPKSKGYEEMVLFVRFLRNFDYK